MTRAEIKEELHKAVETLKRLAKLKADIRATAVVKHQLQRLMQEI